MPLVNPYCDVEAVYEELRSKEPTSATDSGIASEIVESAVNAASRWIERHKGRDYAYHDHTEDALVIRGGMRNGVIAGHFINLPFSPIIAIESLTIDDEEWVLGEDFVFEVGDYRITSLVGDWPITCPSHTVEIVGEFGYNQEDEEDVPDGLPADITRACVLLAAAFTGHNQREVAAVDGSKSAVFDKSIPKAVYDLLGPPYMPV